jgi:hypothetical protein
MLTWHRRGREIEETGSKPRLRFGVQFEIFSRSFDYASTFFKKPTDIANKKQLIGNAPNQSQGCLIIEHILHQRLLTVSREKVVVVKAHKGSVNLRIAKMAGPVERSDAACEALPNEKVSGFPCDLLTGPNEAGSYAFNSSFSDSVHGLNMQIDAPREIETDLNASSNRCIDTNDRH